MSQLCTSQTDWLFQGSGEVRALCRALDWSATTLGPLHRWPHSLRTAVQLVLASPNPTYILWGPTLSQIYNDDFQDLMGHRHPAGLGQSAHRCWPEFWASNQSVYERVWSGEPLRSDEAPVPVTRSSRFKKAAYSWMYSPVRDESGAVSGILVTAFERTSRADISIKTTEPQAFMRQLSEAFYQLSDPKETQAIAVKLLGDHLQADRVYYRGLTGDEALSSQRSQNSLLSMQHRFRSEAFGEELMTFHQTSRTQVISNVETDSTLSEEDRQLLQTEGINAYLTVLLIKGGCCVATLVVHSVRPRNWSDATIELVNETAERTWAAVERAKAEQNLLEANRRNNELMINLGHELRNPVATITNTLLLLQLTRGQDASMPYSKGIEILNQHSQHVNRIIDDLLDYSRIRQGIVRLQRTTINLSLTLQRTVEAAQPLFCEQNRLLTLTLPDTPLHIHGNEDRLTQAIMNLLTNGVKYTESGGQVWVKLERVGDVALIRVRDNGIGLNPGGQDSIFYALAQEQTSPDRTHSGPGIGLAVARQLIEQHDGQIDANSSGPGQGSEFRIQLPLILELSAPAPILQDDAVSGTSRILIIDDNQDFADMTARLLRFKGFDTHICSDGVQGLSVAERMRPDAILLDIGMPYPDGYAVCRQIRSQSWGQAVAILALTGFGQDPSRYNAVTVGFDSYLLKPVHLGKMIETITQSIRRKKASTNQ